MLNELETVYWSLVNLDSKITSYNKDEINVLQHLQMTALRAKKKTNDAKEFKIFETFLTHNYRELMRKFNDWDKTLKENIDNYDYKKVSIEFEELFGEDSSLKECDT